MVLGVILLTVASCVPQDRQAVGAAWAKLQVPAAAQVGAKQLLELARADGCVREQMGKWLPGLIERVPLEPAGDAVTLPRLNRVLYAAAWLAGELRLASTAEALESRMRDAGGPISSTMYSRAHLSGDVLARALVEVGDPAVPWLARALRSPYQSVRDRAVRALLLVCTKRAAATLRAYAATGKDAEPRDSLRARLAQAGRCEEEPKFEKAP